MILKEKKFTQLIQLILGLHKIETQQVKKLKDIHLPNSSLIAGVIRRNDVHIPSGNWEFASKDKLVVFSLPDSIATIEEIFC